MEHQHIMEEQSNIFISPPVQSVQLQTENIEPPNVILVEHHNELTNHKRRADTYLKSVKARKTTNDDIPSADVDNAVAYQIGAHVGALMPAITRALPPTNNNQILEAITNLENRITEQLNSIRTEMRHRAMNATAVLPTDRIYPISIPNQPITDVLPTTLQGLGSLQGRALTAVENYYSLEHDGALQVRIGRIRREYGISPLTLTYH